MKKLVTTPLTRNIYWATMNESKGLITGERKDVTDNAIECVLSHFTYSDAFNNVGFTGYEYDKSNGDGVITICAFDNRYVAINKKLYDEMRDKCLKYDEIVEDGE